MDVRAALPIGGVDQRVEGLASGRRRIGTERRKAAGAKQAWITEAQAEPWESSANTPANPKSTSPQAIRSIFANLKDAGFTTVLFWGSEYWLWREDHGDSRWTDTVKTILRNETRAPLMALAA